VEKLSLTQQELLFVTEFSKVDKTAIVPNSGIQIIDDKVNMEINIFEKCPNLCQVGVKSDVVRFSYEIFEYSPEVKMWMLLWAISRRRTNQDSKADIMATEALFDYRLVEKVNGSFHAYMLNIFSHNPSRQNEQRLENIFETINRKTNVNKKKTISQRIT
jgi:hypothetical protein